MMRSFDNILAPAGLGGRRQVGSEEPTTLRRSALCRSQTSCARLRLVAVILSCLPASTAAANNAPGPGGPDPHGTPVPNRPSPTRLLAHPLRRVRRAMTQPHPTRISWPRLNDALSRLGAGIEHHVDAEKSAAGASPGAGQGGPREPHELQDSAARWLREAIVAGQAGSGGTGDSHPAAQARSKAVAALSRLTDGTADEHAEVPALDNEGNHVRQLRDAVATAWRGGRPRSRARRTRGPRDLSRLLSLLRDGPAIDFSSHAEDGRVEHGHRQLEWAIRDGLEALHRGLQLRLLRSGGRDTELETLLRDAIDIRNKHGVMSRTLSNRTRKKLLAQVTDLAAGGIPSEAEARRLVSDVKSYFAAVDEDPDQVDGAEMSGQARLMQKYEAERASKLQGLRRATASAWRDPGAAINRLAVWENGVEHVGNTHRLSGRPLVGATDVASEIVRLTQKPARSGARAFLRGLIPRRRWTRGLAERAGVAEALAELASGKLGVHGVDAELRSAFGNDAIADLQEAETRAATGWESALLKWRPDKPIETVLAGAVGREQISRLLERVTDGRVSPGPLNPR
jgi:hypothetical protein